MSLTNSDDEDVAEDNQQEEEDSDADENESPGLRKKRKNLESLPVSHPRKWLGDIFWGGNVPLRPMICYAELNDVRVKFKAQIHRLRNRNLILITPTGKKVGKRYSRVIFKRTRWALLVRELNLYIRLCGKCTTSTMGNCWIRLCGYYKTVKKYGNAKSLNIAQDGPTDGEILSTPHSYDENTNESVSQENVIPITTADISDSDNGRNVLSVTNCPFKESLLACVHCMHDVCCGCSQFQPGGQICLTAAARNCKDSPYYMHYCPLCYDEFNWEDSPKSESSDFGESSQTTNSPTKNDMIMSGLVDEMLKD